MDRLPDITFHLRETDETGKEDWVEKTSQDLFGGKKIILFAVPGAFTPTCSKAHLPGFETKAEEFKKLGIDEIYCLSVNDTFIMNEWAAAQKIEHVKMLPDGNGDFSRLLGMLVERNSQGMGLRSWRYALYAEDGEIITCFEEPNRADNPKGVPMTISSAEHMLDYLQDR